MSAISYPNESEAYRNARNELLQAELELRAHVEKVAQQRRNLSLGGLLKEDYIFEELVDNEVRTVTVLGSYLSQRKDTLFLYSFMYAPTMKAACPMCTALLDGLDGQITHLKQQINVAVVAKHSLEKIHEHAQSRGWSNFRLLSSAKNSYNADYFGEQDGGQISNANIFIRNGDEIRITFGDRK